MSSEKATVTTARHHGIEHSTLEGAPKGAIRFRLPRFSAEELRGVPLLVTFQTLQGARVSSPVLDFSESGLCIPIPAYPVLPDGEPLTRVEVRADGRLVFQGRGVAVSHDEPDRMGVAFVGTCLKLGEILPDDKLPLPPAVQEQLGHLPRLLDNRLVPTAYRAAVADQLLLLESLRTMLESSTTALNTEQWLDGVLDQLEARIAAPFLGTVRAMNQALMGVSKDAYELCAQYSKALLLHHWKECPLVRRAYDKPLGYAGDYLLMQRIYSENDEAPTLFGRLLNRLYLKLPVVRAGVNRIPFLAGLLHRECLERPQLDLRIASLACGPAEELVQLLHRPLPARRSLMFSLLDQDTGALAWCNKRFIRLAAQAGLPESVKLEYYNVAIKLILKESAELVGHIGTYDIMYAVGLFDYLPEHIAARLVDNMLGFLNPGGLLVVGNFAPHEASVLMDHLADWKLIYRDHAALLRLGELAVAEKPSRYDIRIETEETGLMQFLMIRRLEG